MWHYVSAPVRLTARNINVKPHANYRFADLCLVIGLLSGLVPGTVHSQGPTDGGGETLSRAELLRLSQDNPDEFALADRYVELFTEYAKERGELEAKQAALDKLKPSQLSRTGFPGLNSEDTAAIDELGKLVLVNVRETKDKIKSHATNHLDPQVQQVNGQWREVRGVRNAWLREQADVSAGKRVGWVVALINEDTRWYWLASSIAIFAVGLVFWHERRHEFRRRSHGVRGRYSVSVGGWLIGLLVMMLAFTVIAFFFSVPIARSLTKAARGEGDPAHQFQQEFEQLQQKKDAIRDDLIRVRKEYDRILELWSQSETDDDLRNEWKQVQSTQLQSQIDLALLDQMPSAIELDELEVRRLQRERKDNQQVIDRYETIQYRVSNGVGSGLTVLLGLFALTIVGGIYRRERTNRRTCPMCGTKGSLRRDEVSTPGVTPKLRCRHEIREGEPCRFECQPSYAHMDRVSFPTLGIPSAGKTHWLAMAYRELSRGGYPGRFSFETIQGKMSEDFDKISKEIIESRVGPSFTPARQLPYPLVFNFRDIDPIPFSTSNLLVNVFDFAGEVGRRGLNDPHRRRQLHADGFLFFLDPTRKSDAQQDELDKLRGELRELLDINSGSIKTAVAVCIPKLDLLLADPDAVKQSESFKGREDEFNPVLYNLNREDLEKYLSSLAKNDPTGRSLDANSIDAWSTETRVLCEKIWPGWNIERQVRDFFGGRYAFFPLTPVGLDSATGESVSLKEVGVMRPYGVLKPLIWMLDMNGYPCLEKGRREKEAS